MGGREKAEGVLHQRDVRWDQNMKNLDCQAKKFGPSHYAERRW